MLLSLYQVSFLLLCCLKSAIAKDCQYIFENGDIKYFHCNMYEYCCGRMCCRSPAMTFYQMWYFWLMVFLTILFCSGGGWFYKIRNHDGFISTSPRVMPPQLASYYGTGGRAPGPQPAGVYPQPNMYPQGAVYPQQMMYVQDPNQYPPPPPYYGPPPSYDTVMQPPQPTQPLALPRLQLPQQPAQPRQG
ncbi:hypothetical protein JTE90_018362 [Oedothorax gibbosus]|uniref:WW domain binding protein VOPP1 n=1 Tax=Oedothorax gibbosus TaxID=931172 RepID=A0AAV6TYW2_9ARAC|nr:hypothetical protein JTE90_018362 [Oedothorax gibbosus]